MRLLQPKLNLDFAGQTRPLFLFKRIELSHYREYINFQLDYGMNFFVRWITVRWPELYPKAAAIPPVAPTNQAPYVYLEFFRDSAPKTRQVEPIPGTMYTPAACAEVRAATEPSPVDMTAMGVNFTARPCKISKILNFLYPFRDNLRIDVTGWDGAKPEFFEIMIAGYYIPEERLKVNKGLKKYV